MQIVMALGVENAIFQKRLVAEYESVRGKYELLEEGAKAEDWARIRLVESFSSLSEIRRPETIEHIAARFMEFVTELRPMRDRIIAG